MKECKSLCPLNQGLEIFGDKWTLLIIRDIMFAGKRYFGELLDSEEKIASNILTNRLNKLEEIELLIKTKDAHHKQKNVYTLTKKGIGLLPVMAEIATWSQNFCIPTDENKEQIEKLKGECGEFQEEIRIQLELELEKILKSKAVS